MFDSTTYSEVVELFGHTGLAEWEGNGDCLNLRFWLQTSTGLRFTEALVPHGLEEDCSYAECPSEQYIEAAKASLVELLATCDENGYNPNGRGYVHIEHLDKMGEIYPWQDSGAEVLRIAKKGVTLREVIRGRCSLPERWKGLDSSLMAYYRSVLALPATRFYLENKADDMANYWADKLGTLGSSGNFMADYLHSKLQASDDTDTNLNDVYKFREALKADILENFEQGIVPFYDTDYGVGYELREVLEKAGLSHLESKFPWKTWQHFDFSDFNMENADA